MQGNKANRQQVCKTQTTTCQKVGASPDQDICEETMYMPAVKLAWKVKEAPSDLEAAGAYRSSPLGRGSNLLKRGAMRVGSAHAQNAESCLDVGASWPLPYSHQAMWQYAEQGIYGVSNI